MPFLEGCRDALVVWQGVLLDGHNRLSICEAHGVEYQTVEIELPDRSAALNWIDLNQLGRRNMTPDQLRLAIGRIYNRRKKTVGGQLPRKGVDQNEPALSTAKEVAAETGVSPRTVKRAAKFAN